jgi:hypothetical protein
VGWGDRELVPGVHGACEKYSDAARVAITAYSPRVVCRRFCRRSAAAIFSLVRLDMSLGYCGEGVVWLGREGQGIGQLAAGRKTEGVVNVVTRCVPTERQGGDCALDVQQACTAGTRRGV